MKKISIKLVAFLCALFAYQGAMAQSIIFQEDFKTSLGDFTIEGTNGPKNNVWMWDTYYKNAVADAYGKFEVGELMEVYLVSPEITLGTSNQVSFGNLGQWFNKINEEVAFCIREAGTTEWVKCAVNWVTKGDPFHPTSTGDIDLPVDYENTKVQFGFKYTSVQPSSSGILHISDFVVKGIAGDAPAEKKDPQITFNVTDVEATMGQAFEAPVLNNPNNVEVVYSTSNPEVATVDAVTGVVTLVSEGVTTIKAVSAETDVYKAGEASYNITVKAAAGAEAEVLFEESFASSLGDFTEENANENIKLWQWFFITKSAYATTDNVMYDSRLISPEIQLAENNTLTMSYRAGDFKDLANEIKMSVKEVGGEWMDVEIPSMINDYSWHDVEIAIPAEFNNKKAHIAIKFNSDYGTFCFKNFVVKGVKAPAPGEKKDPQISFNVGEVEAFMGQAFEAPVLNNPNNVEIVYSSKKPEVATVDPTTGAITLVSEGFTTITATSVENDQYKSAFVNYVLTVKPALDPNVIFEEFFETSLGMFTVEGDKGTGEFPIWANTSGCARADAYGKIFDVTVNYLVSPEMTLDEVGNTVELVYYFNNYGITEVTKQIGVCVREVGGEWEKLVMPVCKASSEFISSGDIVIPSAYAGKKVQIGFKYYAESSNGAGVWGIDQVVVKRSEAAPVEKVDPELSFPEAEYTYIFGPKKFVAPVLNNPNNVEVLYSTNNIDVADVDPYTGEVWVYNYGTVVITAKSVENDKFKEGQASYTLTVTDVPTGIEGVTAEDIKCGKVFNLQGIRVDKLVKGVYIVNGKKIVIK